jgi:hypothetical protein
MNPTPLTAPPQANALARPGRRLVAGAACPAGEHVAISGETVRIPDPAALLHIQFRRFAGCPICNLHLRSFARRHREIAEAGVREVVFFHASPGALAPHVSSLPFVVVGDRDKRTYRAFGVESAPRALLDPRAWWTIVKAVAQATWRILLGTAQAPSLAPEGGRLGLPADFLVDPSGRVVACKYGEHADDQWSVDELLAAACREITERRS